MRLLLIVMGTDLSGTAGSSLQRLHTTLELVQSSRARVQQSRALIVATRRDIQETCEAVHKSLIALHASRESLRLQAHCCETVRPLMDLPSPAERQIPQGGRVGAADIHIFTASYI